MAANRGEQEALLTPAEVASMFRVDPKTVTRWAKGGKLSSIRTLGGHRRYKQSEVEKLLENSGMMIPEDQLPFYKGESED
ncbi:BldC family transcriptional regulator [Jonesia denitrificans]|jgi:excisionase family DNA binding protein|uniref:DNA binding domain protein, excisionase family n=1 Tax=Jonesia denitrificans (strain ATCC 14870 / DSM 20603 / BCRC 15368 / CIP 55.134 / JCM 11481 / NBRC 15587 / NCTC 10816 / Prevot 55134) TaxID=471856 RepID=C7R2J2_JONDD|nr:BldC family transcriptional regulator [Jonesia denitrificans]ACV09983.1 DNA binding domain protein, excisionase family [Jonesia denitrificans DSM 20603]ASE08779.1 helix-turn-helix domain-containing protein [Jonesia denitrificans]QXB43385.1 BldC family transcriptional regulator [Jonesia denitrificans]SQH22757.1 DNA binding domain, excisionase family [Jonesia denitrificans]